MNRGTDREDRDNATNGSAPLTSAPEAPPGLAFSPLRFDAAEFMKFVEDWELTDAQAEALLRAIWDIVVGFVDIAYGLHPVQQAVDRLPFPAMSSTPESGAVVSSRQVSSTTASHKTNGRNGGPGA